MGEKITVGLAGVILVIMLPCLLTLCLNGIRDDVTIDMINTRRDVLIKADGENVLMDVEKYIVGILPGIIEYGSSQEYIEAQVVAVRTKIYYAMGESTVVDAQELGFQYFDQEKLINKYGMDNYKVIEDIFEEAVINTVGETIQDSAQ
ncbi:MAG: SpoIID/LytB domain-containing protein [Lachnospiraceae bacterium]|nr:SpoIID/LytB domain-containing protein [Lachnospiraceae bacterium]MBQ8318348.1 SpoIID/LytB domain-containing protein [Lachnospiraceae bacterium]